MSDHNTPKGQPQQSPQDPSRRRIIGGIAGAIVGSAAIGKAVAREATGVAPAPAASTTAVAVDDTSLKANIDNVVIIYAENRSFNNLFADFPGLQQPLKNVPKERLLQRDRDGKVLDTLPPIWGGMVPHKQVVEHTEYQIGEQDLGEIANGPFALTTPEGDPLPQGVVTRDLIHAYYQNQMQINGGKNDGFVAWGDSGALVMGHYGDNSARLRLWQIASDYTLCDNFFMGAFGGSFFNHQYLVAARPCHYPQAEQSPAKDLIADVEGGDPTSIRLKQKKDSPQSAMQGPAKFVQSKLTPDYFAVNTMLPPYAPTYQLDAENPAYADASSSHTMVPQTHDTIGDKLSEKNIDWAWYSGGWGAALAGNANNEMFPSRPNFQPHHQPLNYFAQFGPETKARQQHLRDAGEGSTPRTNQFLADAVAGKLPSVAYYKPQGNLNMHAGYSDVDAGDRHIASVIDTLKQSPQWDKMLVIVTFDENGGWWDHVAPPKGDRWGPGTRIPAMLIGPHVKKGHVDHTVYDTGSIARFLTRRFGLNKLAGLEMREQAMLAAGGPAPGDLTAALEFSA